MAKHFQRPDGPAFRLHLLITGLLLFIQGCASVPAGLPHPPVDISWPRSSSGPRIQWLGTIHDRRDAGISKSFWRKVVDFFTGEEQEGIVRPYGVYADRSGRVFIADVVAAVVHVYDLKEKEYKVIGKGDTKVFRSPIAVTGDGDHTVFITDSAAGTVFRYDVSSEKLEPLITGKLTRPTGIAFNPRNRLLYISDTANHRVVAFDLEGNERLRIGERGDNRESFNYPTDLFVDAAGEILVTDALNSRIQVFTQDGQFLTMFGAAGDTRGYFAKPKGVAVDSEGHIYVCDALQDMVQIFDRNGNLLLDFGEAGSGPAQFALPSGIYIDAEDTIYVADSYNERVQVFKYRNVPVPVPAPPK